MENQQNQNPEPVEKPAADEPNAVNRSRWQRFKHWYKTDKRKSIPATVIVLAIVLAAIPGTRYKAAGIAVKKDFAIQITDATSHTPVSGAQLSIGSVTAQTDGSGHAKLHLSSGHHTILITKKYYQEQKLNMLVPIFGQKSVPTVQLTATGRQVKITVKNLINGKVLGDVDIAVAGTTAKTNADGTAIVVVPAGAASQKAKLSLNGYNDSQADIKVSSSDIAQNNLSLTPAGKLYFLSKRTGKLNIMKSNLDGSDAQVVVSGTGNERDDDTSILPSADWKFVALLARRDKAHSQPWLYMLSTSGDHLLNIDSNGSGASFRMVGWAGDSLIYYETNGNNYDSSRPSPDKLKSYDAATGKTTLLDQSATIHDADSSAYESYAFVMISGNTVIYAKNWGYGYYADSPPDLSSKKSTLSTISANGQNHKVVASYDADDYISYTQHSPTSAYIWQEKGVTSDHFFDYSVGLAAPKTASIDHDQFYQSSQTYYASPNGNQTFWAENRDGKNTLLIGDAYGNNSSIVASLNKYEPYGWFSDGYLLLTKNNSELYIIGTKGGTPLKVTDYQPTGNSY